jgi:hypothetical protein
MDAKQISETVNKWVDEEELPVSAHLKVERTTARYFSPCENMEDEEAQAYSEFIRGYINKDLQLILSIPKPEPEYDFWPFEFDEDGHNVSASNTIDFQRLNPSKFSKYRYKMQKIYDKVKDLAITHSCISDEQGKKNTIQRFIDLVEREFVAESRILFETYRQYPQWVYKHRLLARIAKNDEKVKKCKIIWKKYAYRE